MTATLGATLRLRLDSARAAEILLGALGPEAGADLPRGRVTLTRSGDTLLFTAHADDVAALRAAVNSYLRWCATALDVATAADHPKGM